ncbi:transposase [Halobacterium noricense]|uniref:transposase n=1 Tax=Halobacterium noricense TaxID=223182 RepID=UPI001E2C0F14|nr:transposase [Halobacterium noricense]UHH25666.1 transposase [Halobacterium noricense]
MPNENPRNTKSRSKIEKEAIELIDEGANAINVVARVDVSSYRSQGDAYDEWHASYPFEAMIRTLYLKDLMGYSDTELHRRLSNNPDEARRLGFEGLPSRTTFVRTWQNRITEQTRTRIQHTTHRILEYAHEHGNPLGLKSLEPDEKDEVSDRTEDRLIREKTLEVTEEFRDLLYGSIDLDRPEAGTQYDTGELLGLESFLSSEACAANGGSQIYEDNAPKGVDVPEGETLLHYIKQLDPADIHDILDEAIEVQLKSAKRHLEFTRPVEIGIDMTYVGYYGEHGPEVNYGPNDEQVVVMGAPPSKGFDWCYKFATVSIVGDNVRFMLAVRPHTKGQSVGELVREIYWAAAEHVSIQTVYADAEFYSAEVIQTLEESSSNYLIRVPANKRVKRQIARANHDVWVEEDVGIYGPTVGGSTRERVETTHVGVPKNQNPDETVVFATNQDVDDEIELDRRETENLINRYRRRWGIETNYRALEEFLPKTTSKDYSVRLFHFGFGVLMFNMWRLVDFLIQISLDTDVRDKPRLTAQRFRNLAETVLNMYG